MPLDVLRAARGAFADPEATADAVRTRVDGLLEVLRGASTAASETMLNPSHIGPHRRFDWIRLDLGEVKRIKERLGGTVNDVVLATVTGATRRFLASHGQVPDALEFRAMIPVSIRVSIRRSQSSDSSRGHGANLRTCAPNRSCTVFTTAEQIPRADDLSRDYKDWLKPNDTLSCWPNAKASPISSSRGPQLIGAPYLATREPADAQRRWHLSTSPQRVFS